MHASFFDVLPSEYLLLKVRTCIVNEAGHSREKRVSCGEHI